jgi:TolB protein
MRRLFLLLLAGGAAISAPAAGQAPAPPAVHGGAPSVSPSGTKIAFLSERDGATDIYVVGADGTGELRVTHTSEAESPPTWSADGKTLFFGIYDNGSSRIFSVGVDGGDPTLVGTVAGRVLCIAPVARSALYWNGTWTAMRMFASKLDGSGSRQLTDGRGVVWGARWSPDGKRIAFADRDAKGELHVWSIDENGENRRELAHLESGQLREQMPAWSPDGSRLAVQAGAEKQPTHIWIVDLATGDGRKIGAHTASYNDEFPSWFPDGKSIAFQSDRTGRIEIWVMNVDGSSPRPVTK